MLPSRSIGILVLVVGLCTAGVVAGTTAVDPDGDGVAPLTELRDGTEVFDADTDDDGLDDGAEKRRGTDPTDPDSDGDGLADGVEVTEYGTDPLASDTDDDGLDDGAEVDEYGTDPLASDTDDDGLADRAEVDEYDTDPLEPDTDGDGLADGPEVTEYGTDPTESDTDGDGLSDAAELEAHGTEPTAADTDDDGLADGPEVNEYDTDPLDPDTDDDGLEDGPEVNEYGTDPNESDTDGDGFADGMEVHRSDLFPDADPLRTDVYVEVDTMERTAFDRDEAERIEREFAAAPLENPDGSTGVSLHFVSGETIPWESSTDTGDLSEHRSRYFEHQGKGYHYLVIVEDVAGDTSRGNVIGKAGLGTMMVEAQPGRDHTGSTVMHELGHSLGLSSTTYEGIDSDRYDFWEYPSVMNYDAPRDYYGFSRGTESKDFDDWGHLAENMYTPPTTAVTDAE